MIKIQSKYRLQLFAKDSSAYWRKREKEALKNRIKDEAEYDKELQKIYESMLKNVQAEIDSFYRKYADKKGISMAEAQKRVSQADIRDYEKKAAEYVKAAAADRQANGGETDYNGYYFSDEANAEMRIYNLKMKVSRLEMLKANIGMELIKGGSELEKFVGNILVGRTMDELERQAGILGKTVINNAKRANAIVNGSFKNATFSQRLWTNQDVMKAELDMLLHRGLIAGKNPRELARDVKKYFIGEPKLKNGKKGAVFASERLLRTELARVQTEAQRQSYERNGFEMYRFIPLSDCCPLCEEVAKKDSGYGQGVYLVKDMMPGENCSPMHPMCRCSTAPYSDRKEYEEWLDYLESGGTTEEWNKLKKKR